MAVVDNPTPGRTISDADLVAEARAEAIHDGDPETCLVRDLANTIERLQAEAEHWKANHDEQVRRKRHISELLAAANADAERLAKRGQAVAERHHAGWRDWEHNPPRSSGHIIYRVMRAWEKALAVHRARIEGDQ